MEIPHPAAFVPLPSAASPSPFVPNAAPQAEPPDSAGEFNFNPYQSPATTATYAPRMTAHSGVPLASLGARLGGAILDGLFTFVGAVPGIIYTVVDAANRPGGPPQPGNEAELIASMAGSLVLIYGGMLVVGIINWILIVQSGQSLGKKIVGTRIVRLDGSLPGFGYGVALRSWVPFFIGLVPWVGGLFSLVNVLFIFGQERRCIHDQIAGTRVVVA